MSAPQASTVKDHNVKNHSVVSMWIYAPIIVTFVAILGPFRVGDSSTNTMELLWPLVLGPVLAFVAYRFVTSYYWKRANAGHHEGEPERGERLKPLWWKRCALFAGLYLLAAVLITLLPVGPGFYSWAWHHAFLGVLLFAATLASYWAVIYRLIRGSKNRARTLIYFMVSVVGMILLESARVYLWNH